ncbi:MAG TPA: peptidase M28 [Planctomycetaceae bacterium]|nr:peptidase M28 [Planctomycetaceae bacterium]HRF00319.1 M28 family peptidase [Pirellulaceae bacterium]
MNRLETRSTRFGAPLATFALAWLSTPWLIALPPLSGKVASQEPPPPAQFERQAIEAAEAFDARRAFADLERIVAFGPRPTGSQAMRDQQAWLVERFREAGLEVLEQRFEHRHEGFEEPVEVVNLIARFRPEANERLLFAAHYDTRPFPDRDPVRPQGRFVGANDGASGVALLLELARHLDRTPPGLGVDLVLFDAEELVLVPRRDPLFVGSTRFAELHRDSAGQRSWEYRHGILVDMVADAKLELYFEKNSLKYAPDLARDVWRSADRLRIREFMPRPRHEIRDDHLPLNEIARIPTIDIVDFDYPRVGARESYWHTEADVPENCSADSLGKVGRTLLHWLARQR